MKYFVILLLSCSAFAQFVPQLPTTWVNSNEWIGRTTNTINFPAVSTGGSWSCGVTNYGPYTAGSQSSLQTAVNDAETCRTANGSGTLIRIPAGAVFSGGASCNGVTATICFPQTSGDTSTNFIVLQSTTSLPVGQTVCSHGIQDNLAASTQPGIRNLGCNGSAMSYQLGSSGTVTPVSGAFTLANGTATNTSAYNDISSMYTIECTVTNCNQLNFTAIDANNIAVHHFAVFNAEIRPQAGLASPGANILIGSGQSTLLSQLPNHIHIAYSYLHGDSGDAPVSGGVATGPPTGANSIPNVFALLGCQQVSLAYNYSDQAWRPGAEGHTVQMTECQQIKIVHNWFEEDDLGTMMGGTSATFGISGFNPGTDVEDRGNRWGYNFTWQLAYAGGFKPNGGTDGFVRKNAHESKGAERYLLDGDIMEHSNSSGGQNGELLTWKTSNGSATTTDPGNWWTIDENVTVTNNIVRDGCQAIAWGFRSSITGGNGGGATLPTQKASFINNLMYDIDIASKPWCIAVSPLTGFRLANNFQDSWTATITRDATGTIATAVLNTQTAGAASGFSVGDPVAVYGCTGDTAFNTMTLPPTATTIGPLAIAPTSPSGLTVTYANVGTPNSSDSTCTVGNNQGWPDYLTHSHNTDILIFVTNAGDPDSSANGGNVPFNLSRNLSFTNDIFSGALTSSFGEGTRTQTKAIDSTSETFNNSIIANRTGAACPGNTGANCYTEYGGSHAGASPPVTIYISPTLNCSGNDPQTGGCVGILGAMSTGSVPIALSDWHNYRLCKASDGATCNSKASLYAAGQANQGSDGLDLGFNPTAVDAAQVSTEYACGSPCGTGPFPDVPPSTAPSPAGMFAIQIEDWIDHQGYGTLAKNEEK